MINHPFIDYRQLIAALKDEMYCPNCGSNNLAEVKFCTRCGTNLTVVTEALTGKLTANQLDERAMKVVKDYYKGRRDAITGAALIPLGALVMTIL